MANWTDKQEEVIKTRDKNILVSAAAGSGKTAVLVERIIRRILDEKNPLDIDRLLVVTYTNAAAYEMKERILAAINEELKENPYNEHLRKQETYIHNARITTIHSFCLGIIKDNFIKLSIDPMVRTMDEGESKLLVEDTLKELIENKYKENSESFINFVSQFQSNRSDKYIENIILNLYKESLNHPWPFLWLDNCKKYYECKDVKEFLELKHFKYLSKNISIRLEGILEKYKEILHLSEKNGIDKYYEFFLREMNEICEIRDAKDYLEKLEKGKNYKFTTLVRVKDVDKEVADEIKAYRKKAKKEFENIQNENFNTDINELFEIIKNEREIVNECIETVKEFITLYGEKKKEKNVVDFSDYEHYAIDLLVKREGDKIIYTDIADNIADGFDEVMIDEYQDCNEIQELILDAVSKNRFGINNRFMVGDIKQSIYKFRGSDSKIFMDKYEKFKDSEGDNKLIVLDKNFRSRTNIIDTTNFFFEQMMRKESGGIDYDDENKLNYGGLYKDGIKNKNEFIILNDFDSDDLEDKKKLTSEEKKKLEIRVIAKRIIELTSEESDFKVYDKEKDECRKARLKDFAILLRSLRGNENIISNELKNMGINVSLKSSDGYFDSEEVSTIVNLLSIIDNRRLDIEFAAVLLSPIVGITENELAKIRGNQDVKNMKNTSLYENVLSYINGEMYENKGFLYDEVLKNKLQSFIKMLDEFRSKEKYLSVSELLNDIYEKTGYYRYVLAMPNGRVKSTNLNMLKNKTTDFENTSYKGLFNFIRYIGKLKKYEIDEGEALDSKEDDDAVKVMTIHKSKGLEFPVVILPFLNSDFYDPRGKISLNSEFGIGINYLDTFTNIEYQNIFKNIISERNKESDIEEEMRIFYVACTRAREKLILSAFVGKGTDIKNMTLKRNDDDIYIGAGNIFASKSYFDFIKYQVGRNKSSDCVYDMFNISRPVKKDIYDKESELIVEIKGGIDIFKDALLWKVNLDKEIMNLKNYNINNVYDDEFRNNLEEKIQSRYKYQEDTYSYAKVSISDLKKESYKSDGDEEDYGYDYKLDFSYDKSSNCYDKTINNYNKIDEEIGREDDKKNKKDFAMIGTTYHKIFEKFDYDLDFTNENAEGNVEEMIENIVSNGFVSEDEMKDINVSDFKGFIKTDICDRMRNAYHGNKLFREHKFVMGITKEEYNNYLEMAKKAGEDIFLENKMNVTSADDFMLVQGIIDAWFIEDGKAVIVDYKTDRVSDLEKLKKRYYVQLEMYSKAIENISGMEVKEKVLYSVRNKDVISW